MGEHNQHLTSNIADIIRSEVNRMCVTNSLTEFDCMYSHAKCNLEKLHKLIYATKFKKGD